MPMTSNGTPRRIRFSSRTRMTSLPQPSDRRQLVSRVAESCPVCEVPRVEDGHAGGVLEGGGDGAVVIADAGRVKVAVVAGDDGSDVGAVAQLAPQAVAQSSKRRA